MPSLAHPTPGLKELLGTFARVAQGGNAPLETRPPNDGKVFFTEDPIEAITAWCEENGVDSFEDPEVRPPNPPLSPP